jgi:hypothetical protein
VLFLHGRDLLFELQVGLESSEIRLPYFHLYSAAADSAVGVLLPPDASITGQASFNFSSKFDLFSKRAICVLFTCF